MQSLHEQEHYSMVEIAPGSLVRSDLWKGLEVRRTPSLCFPASVVRVWPDSDVTIISSITLGEHGETVTLHAWAGPKPEIISEAPTKSIVVIGRGKAELTRSVMRVVYNTVILHCLLENGRVRYRYTVCHQDMRPNGPIVSLGKV